MTELFYDTKFDAAHRLLHHQGKCQNLHGHTWRVRIGVKGKVDVRTGMIVDFAVLKLAAVDLITHLLDHATILNMEDTELVSFLYKRNLRLFQMPGEPTCENLAKLIFERVKEKLDSSLLMLSSITVWESDNAFARYDGHD